MPLTEVNEESLAKLEAESLVLTDKVAAEIFHGLQAGFGILGPVYNGHTDEAKAPFRKLADKVIAIVQYETCEHVWKGGKEPSTPDSPGEYFVVCEVCGNEKQEE